MLYMIDTYYYKNLRVSKGYSLRKLSELTGIHYQQINRFEKGEFELNAEQLVILQRALNIFKETDAKSYETALYVFSKFYKDVFFDRLNTLYYINLIPSKYTDKDEEIIYLVMRFIIDVLEQNHDPYKMIDVLSKYIIENKLVNTAFLDYKGFYQYMKNQHEKAIMTYQQLLSLKCDETVEGMVRYHMSFVYKDLNRFDEAINSLKIAKGIFQRAENLRRLFGCKILLANILLRNRKYEEAEREYLECLHFGNSINIEASEIAKVYRNLSWLMIKEKDYDKAEFYLDKAKLIDENHDLVYVYDTWITYKKKKYNTVKKKIKYYKSLSTDSEVDMILDLFESLCYTEDRKPTLKTVEQCKKVYEYFDLTNNVDLTLFYLDILIELLDRRKDYEKLAFYQKNKIILLEK